MEAKVSLTASTMRRVTGIRQRANALDESISRVIRKDSTHADHEDVISFWELIYSVKFILSHFQETEHPSDVVAGVTSVVTCSLMPTLDELVSLAEDGWIHLAQAMLFGKEAVTTTYDNFIADRSVYMLLKQSQSDIKQLELLMS